MIRRTLLDSDTCSNHSRLEENERLPFDIFKLTASIRRTLEKAFVNMGRRRIPNFIRTPRSLVLTLKNESRSCVRPVTPAAISEFGFVRKMDYRFVRAAASASTNKRRIPLIVETLEPVAPALCSWRLSRRRSVCRQKVCSRRIERRFHIFRADRRRHVIERGCRA